MQTWDEVRSVLDCAQSAADDRNYCEALRQLTSAVAELAIRVQDIEDSRAPDESLEGDPGPDPDKPPLEPLPGPYRVNPEDGNAYRCEYRVPARTRLTLGRQCGIQLDSTVQLTPARVDLTDAFGGHEMTIDEAEWLHWPLSGLSHAVDEFNRGIEAWQEGPR
jgi:hypothetical protein